MMTEILWHGRGGQGAFTAAKILGAAFSLHENFALAFPSFGPERRGAPILAFTKLDSKAIGDRTQIKKADFVIFLDDTLFSLAAFEEIKDGGKIYVNTIKSASEFAAGLENVDAQKINGSIISFNGNEIARRILGAPLSNTAMLSLLAKKENLVSQDDLKQAVKLYMNPKVAEKNLPLVDEIFGGNV